MAKTKKEFIGKVVSDKNDKTITILVETYGKHPLYGKRVKKSKKYTAHDENNTAKTGDTVRIVEARPMSKMKRFRLVEVVEKAITFFNCSTWSRFFNRSNYNIPDTSRLSIASAKTSNNKKFFCTGIVGNFDSWFLH